MGGDAELGCELIASMQEALAVVCSEAEPALVLWNEVLFGAGRQDSWKQRSPGWDSAAPRPDGLQAARDVGAVIVYAGDDRRGFGAVADPVGACLEPGLARPCKERIWPWCGQPRFGTAFDAAFDLAERRAQVADSFGALFTLVVRAQVANLASGLRGVADQGWCDTVRRSAALSSSATSAASSSAIVASNSAWMTDAGTIRPAARSASLRSMEWSHSCDGMWGVLSSMTMQ